MNPLKEQVKLNREIVEQISAELSIPEEKVPRLVELFSEALKPQLGEFVGRRSFLGGLAGIGAGLALTGLAGAKTVISDNNVIIDDQWYLKAPAPFSAFVGIDVTKVIAYDWKGKEIASGVAGVDDAAVIQSAVDYVGQSGGGKIYIHKGTYKIISNDTDAILVQNKDNLELIMSNNAIFEPEDGFNYNIFKFYNCKNVKVVGGVFNGKMGTTYNDNDAIRNFLRFSGCYSITVRDVYAYDVPTGVVLLDGVRKATIENIHVEGWQGDAYPIHLHGYPPGVTGWADINENITIKNCYLDGGLSAGDLDSCGIAVWGINKKLTIEGNHILNSGEFGIYIFEAVTGYRSEKATILNNFVEGAHYGIRIYCVEKTEFIVSKNTLINNTSRGMDITGKLIVTENEVFGGSYAIVWTGGSGKLINNFFYDQTYRNINLASVNDLIIKGNHATCTDIYSFRIDSCSGIILEENIVDKPKYITNTTYRKNSGTSTIATGTTSVTVTHNLISTPSKFRVTPITSLGSATKWWVANITSTTFDIVVDTDPLQNVTFYWEAGV